MFKMIKNKKGFTLVELMVVAVIVAILAAVLIPMMTGNKIRAYATEATAGIGTIKNALRVYWAEHGSYTSCPTTFIASTSGFSIQPGDLDGNFFSDECYSVSFPNGGVTAVDSYVIECDWDAAGNSAPEEQTVDDISGKTTFTANTGKFTGNV